MINIEEYFKYHPPTTQERIDAHNKINQAALEFALALRDLGFEEKEFELILNHIQFARMMANQYVTLRDLKND